jgi:hypothetical protein
VLFDHNDKKPLVSQPVTVSTRLGVRALQGFEIDIRRLITDVVGPVGV